MRTNVLRPYTPRIVIAAAVVAVLGSLAMAASALAAPVITSISTNNGSALGGTTVVLTGTGFTSSSTVSFGSTAASRTYTSSTSMTATSPPGTGTVDITVSSSEGTSPAVPADQFAYDPAPKGVWLGLNTNYGERVLNPPRKFADHGIEYDASYRLEWTAGDLPTLGTWQGKYLSKDIENGFRPIITIEPQGWNPEWNTSALPTGEAITTYVNGFVKTALAVEEMYPTKNVLFQVINEPYGHGNGEEYARILAQLLPKAESEHIPLESIYVAAYGEDRYNSQQWVPEMYATEPKLKEEIKGWYFHPYGPASGEDSTHREGIQSVPTVQATMTSGQNNIIVSEVGFWTPDVNGGIGKSGPKSCQVANSAAAAEALTTMLYNALPMHRAGWLRALLVYSRGTGGWAMEYETSPWALTAQGEALIKFAETAVTPGYGLSIGSHGTAEGQFGKPWAVASDASGNLWAADNNSPQRIERFSPTGSVELAFGSTGIGNGQFSVPEGLAISPVNGKLYVADSGNSRVQEFTASGTFERLFGGPGSSAGKFTSLHGMAIDSSGSVWVAAGGERIERFSATGTFEKEFTISGASIMDLAVRGTTLYATDATHNKVLKIDTGTGLVTGEIGSSGKGEGQMSNPIGIDVDPLTGAVFVADSGNYRVDVFGSDGRALGSFGGLGSNPGQFNLIRDVAVDAADRSVYVSDGNNSRVQKWWIDP